MPDLVELLPLYVVLLFSACFHEVAHAWTAYMCGDDTARLSGRLTLNPIVHIDPIGTIIFPLLGLVMGARFLFGWAKPVPVNPSRFRSYRRDDILVSLSGITANLLLALLAASIFRTITTFSGLFMGSAVAGIILKLLYYLMTINVVLAVFNLVPIPPLDGSRVLFHFLPRRAAWQFQKLERYGFILLILFLYVGIFRGILGVPLKIFYVIAGI
ncbi:MAG: site-2 protease family protein [Candidatus Abyssobacteria bacterium SURF_5]|uniref:Site-2 protease family protein n=1 Tax=Abyssobacteria bacterium (strain SURF_5) TaxID=2093360 RepID=A0A3A4NA37_ABYX5|nr:MAG: site-2 protease family protein [Candidatus Abyssubacteria bacterium SURF_5]